ncbi:MAG: hypothetical protein MUF64_17495 [Polyangiaceae bacterium]|nr:hypothetical protein [Polyangiaceae bacterium]
MARGAREAITNHPIAQEAADECLKEGGSAVDAVLAAFFAIAGATPWGFLAPTTVLVAGSGFGVRAVDGRARQPGQGVERAVRYNDDDSVPLIARASASATPAAISAAASTFGRETLARLAPIGARIARKQGAKQRAQMLTRFGSAKAWVLQDRSLLAEVAERIPRFEGALLQPVDLAIEGVDVLPCETTSLAGTSAALPPWHDPSAARPPLDPTLPPPFRLLALASDRGSLAALLLDQPPLAALLQGPRVTFLTATTDPTPNLDDLAALLAQRDTAPLALRSGATLAVRTSS